MWQRLLFVCCYRFFVMPVMHNVSTVLLDRLHGGISNYGLSALGVGLIGLYSWCWSCKDGLVYITAFLGTGCADNFRNDLFCIECMGRKPYSMPVPMSVIRQSFRHATKHCISLSVVLRKLSHCYSHFHFVNALTTVVQESLKKALITFVSFWPFHVFSVPVSQILGNDAKCATLWKIMGIF